MEIADFGTRLRRLRIARDLQQRDLAATVDARARAAFGRYMSRLEKGREKNPSLAILDRLRVGFGYDTLSAFFAALESDGEASAITNGHGAAVLPSPDLAASFIALGHAYLDVARRLDAPPEIARARAATPRQRRRAREGHR